MPIYMNNAHQSSFDEMAKHLSQYPTKQKSLTWLFFTKDNGEGGGGGGGGGVNGSQNNKLNQGQL